MALDRCFNDLVDEFFIPFLDYMAGQDEKQALREFRRNWDSETPPSLMDVIGGWVLYGNATHVCGSYENFLLAVIVLTDYWTRGDGELHYWEGPNGEQQRIGVYCVDPTFPDSSDYRSHLVVMHDSLNRTLWNVMSAKNAR